ncbi:MAG: branched-chain amino acid ABC transporter substrate-binding protein [Hyphomicrobiales bacterium]|nr:branched-chain amino acid ABC transporter substrate-binding protein [Hyphomicrobiales bacterium]
MKQRLLAGVALASAILLSGAAARADVKLGIGGPITGGSAAFGAQLKMGSEQAVEDINKAGGVLGQKIVSETGDDASDPKQGISVANKFVGDGVTWVVGHFNSSVSIPTSGVYNENAVLQITPASTNPGLTNPDPKTGESKWNVFRTCGRDDQQGAVAGDYIAKNFKDKKVAFVHDKKAYGKGLVDETKKAMNAAGLKEVLYDTINPGEKDYSAIVSKLKAAGVDLVYYGGEQTEAGLLVRQMRDQGMSTILMGGDGIASEEYAQIGGDGVVGTLMTFPPDPRLNPAAANVVKEFEAKKFNPETYTLYSYAAVQVMKQAAEAAKSVDTQAMAKVMHSGMVFHTVVGDISYDKKGDVTRADYVVYRWVKGPDGKITYKQL